MIGIESPGKTRQEVLFALPSGKRAVETRFRPVPAWPVGSLPDVR